MKKQNIEDKDSNLIAIIGAGPAGMIAALHLAKINIKTILVGPKTDANDLRTTALMMPAIEILSDLNIWESIKESAAALSTMRIVDGTKRIIRSPTVSFKASEIGEKAFGYNMPNLVLNKVLEEKVADSPLITRFMTTAKEISHHASGVAVKLDDGKSLETKLIVAADGRNSAARQAAGITTRQWTYPQTAVILSFSHAFAHQNISTEFHTEEGPFTQVPLPGNRSSLVWVANPNHANNLLGMGPRALAKEIETRMASLLGEITVDTPAQGWPLAGVVPKAFAAKRTILVGEAAHIFPPIGAQGLNLGVRDAITIGKVVDQSMADFGCETVIEAYNKARKPDIWARTGAVDALNRALLSNFIPAQIARFTGLELLRRFSPLRGFFMREGMYPGNGLKNVRNVALPFFNLNT